MKNLLIVIFIISLYNVACTANERAKKYGGSQEISLKPNHKLLSVTWKENSMWLLTEDTVSHLKYFREKSEYGIQEGEVIFKNSTDKK